MTAQEIFNVVLAFTNLFTGIGWFRTRQDKIVAEKNARNQDVTFWQTTISAQNTIIEDLRSRLEELEQKYNALKAEFRKATGFIPSGRRKATPPKNHE